jgi:hypothetical protein
MTSLPTPRLRALALPGDRFALVLDNLNDEPADSGTVSIHGDAGWAGTVAFPHAVDLPEPEPALDPAAVASDDALVERLRGLRTLDQVRTERDLDGARLDLDRLQRKHAETLGEVAELWIAIRNVQRRCDRAIEAAASHGAMILARDVAKTLGPALARASVVRDTVLAPAPLAAEPGPVPEPPVAPPWENTMAMLDEVNARLRVTTPAEQGVEGALTVEEARGRAAFHAAGGRVVPMAGA